jgi:ABC-2 type transport system ATP-binding protein
LDAAPAIVARGLEKRFGAVQALAGLDLVVPRGSCFGFIGANGAGKTTFIKLLLGIARPSGGEVEVLGARPDDVRARRRMGYLPERLDLPPAFSAVSFLRSVGRLKGLTARDLDVQVPQLLARVGLPEAAWGRKTRGFSKGMRQRTGLAAALLGAPELLVLDEPTDGIDPMGRAQVREVILDAKRRGTTVFLNSHLLSETERVCDHVAIVSEGRVVRAGPLAELKSERAWRVTFSDTESLDDKAGRHGFLPDEEARAVGQRLVFRLAGEGEETLAKALAGALADGLLVVEVVRALKDLEELLFKAGAARS